MKCPQCTAPVTPLQRACTRCGFTATTLHPLLGNQWIRLERITDAAHCLRLEDTRQAEVVLDDFERSFPQAFFATYLGIISNNLSPAEVGFWLLNQGAFNTHSLQKRNDFGIVLVVDPSAKAVSISLGYAVEACFSERTLSKILNESGIHLSAGRFGKAIETVCLSCARHLKRLAKSSQWTPDHNLGQGMGLEPLRGGHRPASHSRPGISHDV